MPEQSPRDPVIDLLDTTQRETRDLVGALCQVHADRARELLGRDLRDQLSQVVEERFAQLELTMRPRMARARLEVARGIAQVLNECFGRMRRFESDRGWCEAMLDAAAAMSRRCAFFSVRGEQLCLQSVRGLEREATYPPSEVPYVAAPAFLRVIRSAKTHSTARSAAELSLPIAALFGSDNDARALLVPINTGDRVPGVLYAEDVVDPSAMELIATMAGVVLEKHLRLFESVRSTGGPMRPVSIRANDGPSAPPDSMAAIAAPAPPPARDHSQLEAQRFAQVEVARLMLANIDAITSGRRQRNLYRELAPAMDSLRVAYRSRFPAARDYLHVEFVRTLALNDVSLLGREYPTSGD